MVTYDKKQSSSSSSSEEEETQNNRKRENGDSSGVGRSYECVYCKRGFNTAQALGGHMNIHRKDRAKKNKPSTSSKPNIDTNPNLYLSCNNLPDSGHNNNRDHLQLGLMSYGKYNFPESLISTSSDEYLCAGEVHHSYDDHNNQKYCTKDYFDGDYHQGPINPSMGSFDWMRRSSSEYYSPVAAEDLEMNNKQVIDCDEDLDLELRLGHYRS